MQVEIRLRKILQQHRLDRHGVVQQMAADLGVHRHSIGKLYRGQASNPSLKLVGQICIWLKRQGVPASSLPQELFGARPQELWEALSAAATVSIYLGEYQQTEPRLPALRWISRRDAEAVADIVEYLSTPGNISGPSPQVMTEYVPFQYVPKSPTETGKHFRRDIERAKDIFEQMRSRQPKCSAILIGSQRVNYLLEHFVADLFGCRAFHPSRRRGKIPFYLKYRDTDRAVSSCFGGTENPPGQRDAGPPGTYYLSENREWVACPWQEAEADSGVVITVRDRTNEAMEMALFGYSGRATVVLSKCITEAGQAVENFWSPSAQSRARDVGVYICRLTWSRGTGTDRAEYSKLDRFEVMPISKSVMEGCLR